MHAGLSRAVYQTYNTSHSQKRLSFACMDLRPDLSSLRHNACMRLHCLVPVLNALEKQHEREALAAGHGAVALLNCPVPCSPPMTTPFLRQLRPA